MARYHTVMAKKVKFASIKNIGNIPLSYVSHLICFQDFFQMPIATCNG